MFEGRQKVRQHAVNTPAGGIIALMTWNEYPLRIPSLQFSDTFTVITKLKKAVFALGTKVFITVR